MEHLEEIERRIGVTFQNKELLALSFIHRSYWNENQEAVEGHNERLEFLGDSVLGLLIAEHLYTHLPHFSEGELSDLRSRLVEAASCMQYVQKLDIGAFLLLGKGEQRNSGKGRDSILADLFEALIGAIYLDGGFQAAKLFFFRHFKHEMEEIIAHPTQNWKAELQDYSQKKYQTPPLYKVVEESGPSHQKHFKIAVWVNDEKIGEGEGSSKKEAQQEAAKDALSRLS